MWPDKEMIASFWTHSWHIFSILSFAVVFNWSSTCMIIITISARLHSSRDLCETCFSIWFNSSVVRIQFNTRCRSSVISITDFTSSVIHISSSTSNLKFMLSFFSSTSISLDILRMTRKRINSSAASSSLMNEKMIVSSSFSTFIVTSRTESQKLNHQTSKIPSTSNIHSNIILASIASLLNLVLSKAFVWLFFKFYTTSLMSPLVLI